MAILSYRSNTEAKTSPADAHVWERIERGLCRRLSHPDPRVASIALLTNREIEFMDRSDLTFLLSLVDNFADPALRPKTSAPRDYAICPHGELVGFAFNVRRECRSAINRYAVATGGCEFFYDVCLG